MIWIWGYWPVFLRCGCRSRDLNYSSAERGMEVFSLRLFCGETEVCHPHFHFRKINWGNGFMASIMSMDRMGLPFTSQNDYLPICFSGCGGFWSIETIFSMSQHSNRFAFIVIEFSLRRILRKTFFLIFRRFLTKL